MRYLIDGCYGDGNLGDELLLDSLLSMIRDTDPDAVIEVLTADPEETERRTGCRSIEQCHPFGKSIYGCLVKGRLLRIVQAIQRCDVFVLGGGELFRDRAGLRAAAGIHYRVLLARKLGKRVIATGVGAQEPVTRLGRALLKRSLNACHSVLFRDTESLAVARELTGNVDSYQSMPDMVFAWATRRVLETQPEDTSITGLEQPLRLAVALKSVPASHPARQALHERLPSAIRELTDRHERLQLTFVTYSPEDRELSAELERELPTRCNPTVIHDPEGDQILGILRRSDVLIGAPFHSSVMAFSVGLPAIGIAYDRKVTRLYEQFGQSSTCIGYEQIGVELIEKALSELVTRRAETSTQLTATSDSFAEGVRHAVTDELSGMRPLSALIAEPEHGESRSCSDELRATDGHSRDSGLQRREYDLSCR